MNKNLYTFLFTIISTILNIIAALILIAVLGGLSYVVMNFMLHIESPETYVIVWVFCFLIGMVANMFIFTKISNIVVQKFHIAEKLDSRFVSRSFNSNTETTSAEPQKRKTVLPDSVLDDDEDEE